MEGVRPPSVRPEAGAITKRGVPRIDYDVLAQAYEDALARIEILEEYATRMLMLCGDFRKFEP
jgi:hypothetical protein